MRRPQIKDDETVTVGQAVANIDAGAPLVVLQRHRLLHTLEFCLLNSNSQQSPSTFICCTSSMHEVS
jgi:hypothetical protein